MNHKHLQVSALALAMSISGYSFAGGYIGVGIGQTSVDICGDLIAVGATSCDDEDTGFKFFGGYDVNKNIAIEGSYMDLGEVSGAVGSTGFKAEADAFTIAGKGSIPINESFSIFGKAGIAFWDAEGSVSGFGSISDDGTDLIFGIGAEYSATDQFGIRGEWERVDLDGEDADMLSISAVMKF